MTIVSAQAQDDGVRRRYVYKQADDAATPADVVVYPGFKPTKVTFLNVTTRVMKEWFYGMNQGDNINTAADGVRTLATSDLLDVEVDSGLRPSITVAAAAIAQNDLITIIAEG